MTDEELLDLYEARARSLAKVLGMEHMQPALVFAEAERRLKEQAAEKLAKTNRTNHAA